MLLLAAPRGPRRGLATDTATTCHKFMTLLKIVVVNGSHGVRSSEYLGIFVLLWRLLHYVAFVSSAHYMGEGRELYASENAI